MAVEYSGLSFERPGHSTVRIETGGGVVVYIDPWSEVIDGEPGDADVVFVTHDDRDHYDPDGIDAVAGSETTVAAYEAIDTSDLGADVVQLAFEDTETVEDIDVETVAAYNRSDGDHVDEDGNPYHAENEVIGLVLAIDTAMIYYPSDTDFLEDHEEIMADVVMPPIGGSYTMDRHQAADLVKAVEPDLVLPVHYNTDQVPGIEADADAFKAEVEEDGPTVTLF